ncbi:hypothetical protein C8F01DRAFT_1227923 [Mycena amicta]|nr:hypothetical protein C8F01DRAFT_1227923 [Mycena amicta]
MMDPELRAPPPEPEPEPILPPSIYFNHDPLPYPEHMYVECDTPFCGARNPPVAKAGQHTCTGEGCIGNYFVTEEQAKNFKVMLGLRKLDTGDLIATGMSAVRNRSKLRLAHANASTGELCDLCHRPHDDLFPSIWPWLASKGSRESRAQGIGRILWVVGREVRRHRSNTSAYTNHRRRPATLNTMPRKRDADCVLIGRFRP